MEAGDLFVEQLSRGYAWLDTGTHESLVEASEFVRAVQKRQGVHIACLEEIAYANGFIDREALRSRGKLFEKTSYGRYLLGIAEREAGPDSRDLW
jgi:glucose-1-phosphate thymidylyltransferase